MSGNYLDMMMIDKNKPKKKSRVDDLFSNFFFSFLFEFARHFIILPIKNTYLQQLLIAHITYCLI